MLSPSSVPWTHANRRLPKTASSTRVAHSASAHSLHVCRHCRRAPRLYRAGRAACARHRCSGERTTHALPTDQNRAGTTDASSESCGHATVSRSVWTGYAADYRPVMAAGTVRRGVKSQAARVRPYVPARACCRDAKKGGKPRSPVFTLEYRCGAREAGRIAVERHRELVGATECLMGAHCPGSRRARCLRRAKESTRRARAVSWSQPAVRRT